VERVQADGGLRDALTRDRQIGAAGIGADRFDSGGAGMFYCFIAN
jgi:hypothetical protein